MKRRVHSHRQKNCRTAYIQTSCVFRLRDSLKQKAPFPMEYYQSGLFVSFGTKLISTIFFIVIVIEFGYKNILFNIFQPNVTQ